ncbi:hypothetical protein [Psychrobacter sp. AOP7-A1-24]|uniref:hypothetical protein n=1 Tax=Psychrobacter sp. AOP7-A1-24 TaxID=3457646 RepID=UPI00402B7EA1
MSMPAPIESKTQELKLKLVSQTSLLTALRIVKYHASKLVSIKMSRKTAMKIQSSFIPPQSVMNNNPFKTPIKFEGFDITIDDGMEFEAVDILYEREYAYDDNDIRRKLKSYTLQ